MMKIGLLGVGTVGGGVVDILAKNSAHIAKRTGENIKIALAAVEKIKTLNHPLKKTLTLTEDPFAVVNHPEVAVVLELIGGVDIAKELVKTAITNKKHVITANKALIAEHGNELLDLALEYNVALLFEASVAGGVPIIRSLEQGLSANKIQWIAGIINGTSNFILTEMQNKHHNFADILKQAQHLGYAEADPTFDIEGIDAAHKLAILTTLAYGTPFAFKCVMCEGISHIRREDIDYADKFGYSIKHLGIAKKRANTIEMRVHPTLIPKSSMLAHVDGVMNACLIKGNAVGCTMYYGPGAGSHATASAVIADLIDIITGSYQKNEYRNWQKEKCNYQTEDEIGSVYYLHALVDDSTGVLATITQTLASYNISIESIIQNPKDNGTASIAMLTNNAITHTVKQAISEMSMHHFIKEKIRMIRLEMLE